MSGTTLKILGIALIVMGGAVYAGAGDPEDNPAALVGPVIMAAGMLLHFRGRRKVAKAIAESATSPLLDDKPDVLYLRSFRSDTSRADKILMSGLSTEEEQLAEAVRPFGDLIAIGRPGEHLPEPGASRVYASDDHWKSVIVERMRIAPLVIIRAGSGLGLLWECRQAFSTLRADRLVILILNMKVEEYHDFATQIKDALHIQLPPIGRCSLSSAIVDFRNNPSKVTPGFITFSSDWRAQFLPLPFSIVRLGYHDLTNGLRRALRPVFEAHGVPWHAATRLGIASSRRQSAG